jgi:DNA-binding NtrC family response regulator
MGKDSRVLIVDDDSGTCETLSDILTGSGFIVAVAKCGEECLEKIKKSHFDFVLMDVKMPGLSGVETFKIIRDMDKETKVIIMTAYSVDDLVLEAVKEGAFSVIYKPLNLDSLISMLRN